MNAREEICELIRELGYQDHANDTDFSEQITDIFVNSEGASAERIRNELDALRLDEQITDAEQLVVVTRVVQKLPDLIDSLRVR